MPTRRCAFLSMDSLDGFYSYDDTAVPHLNRLGWQVESPSWRSTNEDWSRFDLVVIRTPWDYQQDADRFLKVLSQITDAGTLLANSLQTVQWNLNKGYLRELLAAGCPVIPTLFARPLTADDLQGALEQFDTSELVVKPVVGANSDRTWRVSAADLNSTAVNGRCERLAEILADYADGSEALIQPFVPSVTEYGEVSLFYFSGGYSHAVLKTPAAGDFRVQEEHGGRLKSLVASDMQHAVGDAALAALPEKTLYARVDLVEGPSGEWQVMEVELIEPSLYLSFDDAAPERFANCIDQWFRDARGD